jgi:hypothetical protein
MSAAFGPLDSLQGLPRKDGEESPRYGKGCGLVVKLYRAMGEPKLEEISASQKR